MNLHPVPVSNTFSPKRGTVFKGNYHCSSIKRWALLLYIRGRADAFPARAARHKPVVIVESQELIYLLCFILK